MRQPLKIWTLACAKVGKTIAERALKELESLVTSALAVLEEQGLYAFFSISR